MRRFRIPISFTLAFLAALGAGLLLADDKPQPVERLTAVAVALGQGKSSRLDITINRWSTDEEREMLLTTLQEFGREKLVETLMKIRPTCGYMRLPNTMGYDLYYARNNVLPDGSRHIVLATNRYIRFGEVVTAQRSQNYDAAVIEIHMDKDGKGEGKMQPAAKISWDNAKKTIEIENYGAMPIDLKGVKSTLKK